MATSAFKSTSKRGHLNSAAPLRNRDSSDSKNCSTQATARKRSSSVSAISRAKPSFDFSNKRENPLFWDSLLSPTDNGSNGIPVSARDGKPWEGLAVESSTKKCLTKTTATETIQRGRSVTRNSGVDNGIGRSVSRVGRRSVSRGHYNSSYASENEQEVATLTCSRNSDLKQIIYNVKNDSIVRNSADIRGCSQDVKTLNSQCENTECSEDDSTCSFQISNWEDRMSLCSLSEAEEKTVKAVCEQMKPFQNELSVDGSSSVIYETVRSEVRRAISDIQSDIESAIRRNNVNATATSSIADIPRNIVDDGAEFMLDIKRECTRKLEESEELARKLRANLAVEEHRAKELSRILQEIIPDPKKSNPQKSRIGRKRSNERKKISRRLTEEAMAYFDECVSLSTFDSSDFSAPEDAPLCLFDGSMSVPEQILGHNMNLEALENYSNNKQAAAILCGLDGHRNSCEDSNLTANSSNSVSAIEKQAGVEAEGSGSSQPEQFSFAEKLEENFNPDDFKSYIKQFERKGVVGDMVRSEPDFEKHDYSSVQSLLFERVFSRNRIESGGLHLCPGNFMVSFSLFGSVV